MMPTIRASLLAILVAIFVSACGSGGSTGSSGQGDAEAASQEVAVDG